MTKLEMAHEYAKELLKTTHANHGYLSEAEIENISETAFALAGAMQAEADKRSDMERPAVPQDEWQPDWSAAPEWADCWSVNGMDGNAYWFSSVNDSYEKAPLFGYDGQWVGSFRKKPWGF